MLGQIADVTFCLVGIFENIVARNGYTSRSGGKVTREDIHGCRFTGTVRTEKTENLSIFDSEADVIYCKLIAVALREIFNLNHIYTSNYALKQSIIHNKIFIPEY